MKVDTGLTTGLGGVGDEAATAEATGYDGVWSAEVAHDPFLPLVAAADRTERVELGTSIVVAFARTPMTTAHTAWDLQAHSGGRLLLGLGSQIRPHIQRRFSMPWSRPAARMREYVLALRAIWEAWQHDAPLDFDGEFYTHTLMTPTFNPGPVAAGPPKVFIAAVGPVMTRVAAEVADGVLLHAFTTRRYVEEVSLPVIEETLAANGRARSDFDVKYSPFLVTGSDDEEMAATSAAVRRQIAFYGSTPAYRPVLEHHGWGELQDELHRLSKQGAWQEMGERIDDDVLAAFAVVSDLEGVGEALAARVKGLADRTTLRLPDSATAAQTTATLRALQSA